MAGDAKDELKQEITTDFNAPDVKGKIVRFTDVRAAFMKAARKEFGWVIEKVISHEMSAMEKKKHLPETFAGSKFGDNLIQAVDDGDVPAIGYKVMKEKVTPMLVNAIREAPEQPVPVESAGNTAPAAPAPAPKPKM